MTVINKFDVEKNAIIKNIDYNNSVLRKLINSNDRINLLNQDQLKELQHIEKNNEKFKYKLESNEFEIAIVGLEKAGKSTFANALIKNNILPSAPERCTFTSTRLVSGTDRASVKFYTEQEFNNIFVTLVDEIGYQPHGGSPISFRDINLEDFENYFSKLEDSDPALYKSHIGKTDEEIKDIIKCRDKLILTGEVKEFSGDQLKENDFQEYIKGQDKGRDTSKPRSVSHIEIESSELKQLENAIIYDVPGFDSPTKIHLRQTEERLKAADAIILVTNVGVNPSLQGTTLSIITKNTDEDGIALKDKLFVFGNQLDRVNNEEDLISNPKILIQDVQKYNIGEEHRVFVGSAYKYLANENIIGDVKLNYDIHNTGIDDIRIALIQYYETERFEILKRKIDTNNKLMESIFDGILKDSDFDENFSEQSEQAKITKESYRLIEENLKSNLNKLRDELKKEIIGNSYFSNKFKYELSNDRYFNEITEDQFETYRINNSDSIRLDTPINKINQKIREDLHKKYLEDFSYLIKSMTDNKAKEIEINFIREFTESICLGSSEKITEVEPLCKNYINKLTRDISHKESSFIYLIERFSRDIFDALLSAPILSHDRVNRYLSSKNEFIYLDSYYSNGKGKLVNLILIQKDGTLFDLEKLDQIPTLTTRLISLSSGISGGADIINKLTTLLGLLKYAKTNYSIDDIIGVQNILRDGHSSENKEEVLKEINNDILNLKKILEKAIIPASNLELAFLNSIDKQIKRTISAFRDHDSQFSNHWDDFISKIVPIVKSDEFQNIEEKIENHKLHKQLLDDIRSILH
ncbi:dynamin family protein [Ignatzschineria larvae DSM 13226]|uniref:Dynamin family protein n=1 Tax=Ignatzschineria larvae DSM 13226 TaxID=1111732 RepID=A0ABZ3C2I6_9GAMM|nr:dynamin family protein [Ignatzschineria larvae]